MPVCLPWQFFPTSAYLYHALPFALLPPLPLPLHLPLRREGLLTATTPCAHLTLCVTTCTYLLYCLTFLCMHLHLAPTHFACTHTGLALPCGAALPLKALPARWKALCGRTFWDATHIASCLGPAFPLCPCLPVLPFPTPVIDPLYALVLDYLLFSPLPPYSNFPNLCVLHTVCFPSAGSTTWEIPHALPTHKHCEF